MGKLLEGGERDPHEWNAGIQRAPNRAANLAGGGSGEERRQDYARGESGVDRSTSDDSNASANRGRQEETLPSLRDPGRATDKLLVVSAAITTVDNRRPAHDRTARALAADYVWSAPAPSG